MPAIKFSHPYSKLKNKQGEMVESAQLLEVIPSNLEDLSKEFLAYDTDHGTYKLPKKGKYLMLVFLKPRHKITEACNLFTTIRKWTPEKEDYYKSLIGKYLTVEIKKEDENG